jgi:hypothetical protein
MRIKFQSIHRAREDDKLKKNTQNQFQTWLTLELNHHNDERGKWKEKTSISAFRFHTVPAFTMCCTKMKKERTHCYKLTWHNTMIQAIIMFIRRTWQPDQEARC